MGLNMAGLGGTEEKRSGITLSKGSCNCLAGDATC